MRTQRLLPDYKTTFSLELVPLSASKVLQNHIDRTTLNFLPTMDNNPQNTNRRALRSTGQPPADNESQLNAGLADQDTPDEITRVGPPKNKNKNIKETKVRLLNAY